MTLLKGASRNSSDAMRFGELVVVVLLWSFATQWLLALESVLNIKLPEIPLLKHSYVNVIIALLILVWLRFRGEKLSELGLIVPKRWLLYIGQGLLLFVLMMFFGSVVRPMLDPVIANLTGTSSTLAQQYFAPLKGNLGLLLYIIPVGAWILGGFVEEFVFRGFIMTRIAQLLGESRLAWVAAVFLQAIPFAIGHIYQGPVGVVGIYIASVLTGFAVLIFKRNLWPAIIAHGLEDTVGFIAFYAGIAHG